MEATGRKHGIEHPMQMTVGMSNGERLWAVRCSSQHESRTLFVSEQADTLRKLHPDNPRLQQFTDEDRIVVSEPPGDLPGAWLAVPESTALIIPARQRRTTAVSTPAGRRRERITMSADDPAFQDASEGERRPTGHSTKPEGGGSCSPGSC